MAGFPMIDTGYKPEGALGALYQGYNAGAAEQEQRNQMIASSLENIKNTLANYKAQQMLPNELAVSDLEGSKARQQLTPDMLAAFARGKAGEYGQQEAAGKVKLGTADTDILAGNAGNRQTVANSNELDLFRYADMWKQAGGNPEVAASMGMPAQFIEKFTKIPDMDNRIGNFRTDRTFNDPKHRQAVEIENLKGWLDMQKQELANQGAVANAGKSQSTEMVKLYNTLSGNVRNYVDEEARLTKDLNKEKQGINRQLNASEFLRDPEYLALSSDQERKAYLDNKLEQRYQQLPSAMALANLQRNLTEDRVKLRWLEENLGIKGTTADPEKKPLTTKPALPPGVTIKPPKTP